MVEIKCISGDPFYMESKLEDAMNEGFEIIDITTNLYHSSGGERKETTAYLKKVIN